MLRLAVSDTSPIQYLYQLGQIHLLPRFYTEVIIPPAVEQEVAVGRSAGVNLPDLSTFPYRRTCVGPYRTLDLSDQIRWR
jgi:predicted nucleic acid-binding protein